MAGRPSCWCGNVELATFYPGYLRCPACETLVSAERTGPELSRVTDETRDFYGREYWFSYQEKHLGHPTIPARARLDLPERCLYWLRAVLKYKLPPARVLELGSGHGGFVALLRWAGFDATGLEISPWVAEFARQAFGVPMLVGPVEDQLIQPASLDLIVLMDVLEHLQDPAGTMRHCLGLLKPDGILLIQTPCYQEGSSYEQLAAHTGRPLEILQPREHLYLFSRRSLSDLFRRLGAAHIAFEPAIFAEYDMFTVVSRAPLVEYSAVDAGRALDAAPSARMVRALLDLGAGLDELKRRNAESEADRAARLEVIEAQGRQLGEVEAERNNLRAEVAALLQHRDVIEADRAARLEVIEAQGRQLGEVEAERNNLRAEAAAALQHRDVIEAERNDLRTEVSAQLEQIQLLLSQLRMLQRSFQAIQKTRAYRLLRKLGCWKWFDQALDHPAAGDPARCQEETAAESKGAISPFAGYRRSIDRFNASQPNTELLDAIRAYNHRMIEEINRIRPLKGSLLLDVGASPHGYALERALEHGATLYVGVGLDIARPEHVLGDAGNVGMLLRGDATSLQFPNAIFDAVLSISTLEHVLDVDQVLSEIARVLRPGGQAFLEFEPIWSSPGGHHLHHFGDCARLVPAWAHLTQTPDELREFLAQRWPPSAFSLDQVVDWVYHGDAINRLTIRDYRDCFKRCPLKVEWIVDLKEVNPDQEAIRNAAALTGLSAEELTTKGLRVLLRKDAQE